MRHASDGPAGRTAPWVGAAWGRRLMPFLLSQLIDVCRWLGALAVLALHTTNFFVNLGDIMSALHAPPVYVWWFFTAAECGHQAVVGFFVISGYLVGGGVLARMRAGQQDLRSYFIHRFSRIYLVLGPALLLTLVLDFAGRALFPDARVYDWPAFKGHDSATLFFATLANLQGIFFDYFGTNGPLWSLACEFWYYVFFPLLLLPFARSRPSRGRVVVFAASLLAFFAFARTPGWFAFGFIIWSMGAFATLAPRAPIRSRTVAFALLVVCLVVIRLAVRGPLVSAYPWSVNVADLSSATFFVCLLLAFRDGPRDGVRVLQAKFHKPLADFSFSLYSIHLPILAFARAASEHVLGEAWITRLAQPGNYTFALAIMSIAVFAAWRFSRLTEARTGAARRAIRAFLDRVAPAALAHPGR